MHMSESSHKSLYFIAILPPEDIRLEVQKIKQDLQSEHGVSHALKSPAHVTLVPPFKAGTKEILELKAVLNDFALKHSSFDVHLSGYGCFAPKVVYINIENWTHLEKLYQGLKMELDGTEPLKNSLQRKFHPHMTLATRDVKPIVFQQIWDQYKSMDFKADFVAKGITLLKHNGRMWEVDKSFSFADA